MDWYLKVIKNYATFNGRARRKEFWMFFLFNALIATGFSIIDNIIGTDFIVVGHELKFRAGGLLQNLYSLAVFIPCIAVSIRRMHDIGRTGWFILIPVVNVIMACFKGEIGDNRFGKDPKADVGPIV